MHAASTHVKQQNNVALWGETKATRAAKLGHPQNNWDALDGNRTVARGFRAILENPLSPFAIPHAS